MSYCQMTWLTSTVFLGVADSRLNYLPESVDGYTLPIVTRYYSFNSTRQYPPICLLVYSRVPYATSVQGDSCCAIVP
ncbi:hypothetical protein BDV26DRAFT_270222 [Aspergillus bertholletiae]|uniref:Uncharacterized protein n=1 Tax=Aspergillus bertholletiae TaxID=1226010 RepID=A0A5N7AZM0_9EURO|nr:hypothetical protein BDV26DRAFT_270222 [Aspergillus bertholletiae]